MIVVFECIVLGYVDTLHPRQSTLYPHTIMEEYCGGKLILLYDAGRSVSSGESSLEIWTWWPTSVRIRC